MAAAAADEDAHQENVKLAKMRKMKGRGEERNRRREERRGEKKRRGVTKKGSKSKNI